MAMANSAGQTIFEEMHERLHDLVPEPEISLKAELVAKINRLKEERDAIILGHNYMEPALYHFVADHRGDSLELCHKAAQAEEEVIVFCGVRFMAETAKIINPSKTVLLPSLEAGCSLAASITAEDVRELKRRMPGIPVVSYINTYAEVKAESDLCCTSSNAAAVIASLDSDTVIFLPDEYLAKNVAKETGKTIVFPQSGAFQDTETNGDQGTLIGWTGKCEVHEKFSVQDIEDIRQQYSDVKVLAHPECSPEVVEAADYSGSTSAMIHYVKTKQASRFLLLTECSMGDNIIAENPGREILRLCSVRCPHMNQITLEQTLASLENNQYVIEVAPQIQSKAKKALDRMLAVKQGPFLD